MRDDAGNPVKILNPHGFAEWPTLGDQRIARVRSFVTSFTSQPGLAELGIIALFIAPLVVGIWAGLYWYMHAVLRMSMPGWIDVGLGGGLCWGVGSLARANRRRRHASRIADIMLADGLCPSCGYNLHGVTPALAGTLRCPECAATWSALRIQRTAPFADGCSMGPALHGLIKTTGFEEQSTNDVLGSSVRVSLRYLRHISRDAHSLVAGRVRTAIVAARTRPFRRAILVSLAMLALIGLCLAIAYVLSSIFPLSVALSLLVILPILAWRFATPGPADLVSAMLDQRLCPSCAADLRSAPTHPVITCPSCSASWRCTGAPDDSVPDETPTSHTPA